MGLPASIALRASRARPGCAILSCMDSIIVCGGVRLAGEVSVEGAKNSALKLMAASLMVPGVTRLTNVPRIADVEVMAEVLHRLGAPVTRSGHVIEIDATNLASHEAPYDLVARMRASTAVLGPLIARLGQARVALPGGCNIGSRKIDMHIRGLEALGVRTCTEHGYISAEAPSGGLRAATISLDFPSVGATENLLMTAALTPGVTTINNAAREPEIADLAKMLGACGAGVTGAGTSVIVVEGVERLSPAEHRVIGDRIEAGTFVVAGALCGGPVKVTGFDPLDLEIVIDKLVRARCQVTMGEDHIVVSRDEPIRATDIQTLPFPGFPTDMQAQFMALLALADGDSIITENVFENRFMFADELARMGADIRIEGHHALVRGVERLSGAPVRSTDLRGGAALVLAGLAAEGETVVGDVHHIDRGYERFTEKLASLGAAVERRADVTDFDGVC